MPCYSIGLDLGQVRDYSALILTERVQVFDSVAPDRYAPDEESETVIDTYHVRHIHRWSLGTDYTDVVKDVVALWADDELAYALLVVDRTGVGGGVVDLFRQYQRDSRMGRVPLRALTLTAGNSPLTASEGTAWHTAHKGDLVARLLMLALRGRIKIAQDLPGADALTKELRAFELKQNARTGNVRFEAKRESDHDDLVIALALSVWFRNYMEEPRFVAANGTLQEKPRAIARSIAFPDADA